MINWRPCCTGWLWLERADRRTNAARHLRDTASAVRRAREAPRPLPPTPTHAHALRWRPPQRGAPCRCSRARAPRVARARGGIAHAHTRGARWLPPRVYGPLVYAARSAASCALSRGSSWRSSSWGGRLIQRTALAASSRYAPTNPATSRADTVSNSPPAHRLRKNPTAHGATALQRWLPLYAASTAPCSHRAMTKHVATP